MSVFRIHHQKEYTVVSNSVIRDKNLSLKSLGLFIKMLSLPHDWDYSVEGLATICKDGVGAVRTGLLELEECGYLVRTKVYTDGKVSDINYDLYEIPISEYKSTQESTLVTETNATLAEPAKEDATASKQSDATPNTTTTDISDEEFFETHKNKKDPKTLMAWTIRKVSNPDTVNALMDWLKLMLANNKWQTLSAYDKKLEYLFNNKGNLAVADIVNDASEKCYFSFKYSIDYLNKQKYNNNNKPVYQYTSTVKQTSDKFGVDRDFDVSRDEVF